MLELVAKTQLAAKTLKKDHSSEMSEMGIVEGQTQCSQAFGHRKKSKKGGFELNPQSVQKGRFVDYPYCIDLPAKMLCFF